MREAKAILQKQMIDTRKNRAVLIQFILFPLITIVMSNAVNIQDMPEHFYLKLFSVMYLAMAPISSMSAIISEEKEKGTLRALMMSNVSPVSYLLGVGIYDLAACMLGATLMSRICGMNGEEWRYYLALMAIGFLISIFLGAAIGVLAKNQMAATSLQGPAMCILSFLPMIGQFNGTVAKVAKYFYTEQFYQLLNNGIHGKMSTESMVILACNAIIILGVFILAYKKRGLNRE